MAHKFGTAVLILAVFFSVLTTLSAGLTPVQFAQRLGLKVMDAGGVNEVRAQYAFFFLAIAIVCVAAFFGALSRESAFVVLATVFGGLIAGRLVSLGINGGFAGYGPTIVALYAIDALGFVLSVTAFALNASMR
jgi:hypothetical protein